MSSFAITQRTIGSAAVLIIVCSLPLPNSSLSQVAMADSLKVLAVPLLGFSITHPSSWKSNSYLTAERLKDANRQGFAEINGPGVEIEMTYEMKPANQTLYRYMLKEREGYHSVLSTELIKPNGIDTYRIRAIVDGPEGFVYFVELLSEIDRRTVITQAGYLDERSLRTKNATYQKLVQVMCSIKRI